MSAINISPENLERILIDLDAGATRMNSMAAVAAYMHEADIDPQLRHIFGLFASAFDDVANLLDVAEETLRHMPRAARSLEVSA
jgi:hypothetical protein